MSKVISFYTDLFSSPNLNLDEKYVLTQIRYGTEKFGQYSINYNKLSEYSNFCFDPDRLKFCTEKLVAFGIVESKDIEVKLEGREQPFMAKSVKVNEGILKKYL